MERQKKIEEIESESFEAKTFSSTRDDKNVSILYSII